MIPMMNIIAWSNVVPWAEQRQVEQDLIEAAASVSSKFDGHPPDNGVRQRHILTLD
jgi:hypothetical protein